MTLVNCPACAHSVSAAAQRCPQCGHPINRGRRMLIVLAVAGAVMACSFVLIRLLNWVRWGRT